MANGFAPALIMQSKAAFSTAAPISKITPPGYLKMLLNQPKANIVSQGIDDGSGYIKSMIIKYRKRVPVGSSSDDDDCLIDRKPAYTEATVSTTLFKKQSFFIEDDTIAQYEADALANTQQGAPATAVMKEVWDIIIEHANALFGDINNALLSKQVANFGVNQVTGAATSTSLNFPVDLTTNPLNQGFTKLMDDILNNEMRYENVTLVGHGFINQAYIQKMQGTQMSAQVNVPNGMPKFFFDPYAASAWGANQFGVFDAGAVQLIHTCRFRGTKGGVKPNTILGTITLPVYDAIGDSLKSFEFDFQIDYNKCPGDLEIGGSTVSNNKRGYIMTLMASFDQFNIPATAYESTDRLYQNNGTLRYTATNA